MHANSFDMQAQGMGFAVVFTMHIMHLDAQHMNAILPVSASASLQSLKPSLRSAEMLAREKSNSARGSWWYISLYVS